MRYFMSIIPPGDYNDEQPAPQSLIDAMGPFIEKVIAEGSMISTAGLKATASGTRLDGKGNQINVTDGPFTEAKEIIGGYAVIEAPSREQALQLARNFVQLHIDHGMPNIVVEVREIEGGYNY